MHASLFIMRILLAASFVAVLASQSGLSTMSFEEQNHARQTTPSHNRSLIIVEEQELRNISTWSTLFMIVIRFMGQIAFEPKHNPTAALRCEIFARYGNVVRNFLYFCPLTVTSSDMITPESRYQH